MHLVDTNILIYHINRLIPHKSEEKLRDILVNHFNISVITKMEFLGLKGHTQESFDKSKLFLVHASIYPVDDLIVEAVINLRRKHSLKLPDAIIAATAINRGLTIVTRNENDFNGLEIPIFNPFSI